MTVFLHGRFVTEEKALVSVFDRSFLYGDGLFETIRIYRGKPFRWMQHLERLQRGAEFLRMEFPFTANQMGIFATELIQQNRMPESILRISLSRGVGTRGYSPKGATTPLLVMALHPAKRIDATKPFRWRLITASTRLPSPNPLAAYKTCNKLAQILARAEAETKGADEALLLNTDEEVAEGSSSNLFWINKGVVFTPPVESGILSGVTRSLVMELCQALEIPCCEKRAKLVILKKADAVFLTLTPLEIVHVRSLDGANLRISPIARKLHGAYRELVERETSFEN